LVNKKQKKLKAKTVSAKAKATTAKGAMKP